MMSRVSGERAGEGGPGGGQDSKASDAADAADAATPVPPVGSGPLTRKEFLDKLWMALLFEEEVVATQYRDRVEGLDDVELREVLGEMIAEAADHKGELLQLIEEVEA